MKKFCTEIILIMFCVLELVYIISTEKRISNLQQYCINNFETSSNKNAKQDMDIRIIKSDIRIMNEKINGVYAE